MAEYLSPGVYVEEYDNSPRTIEGVGTSIAGFVGMAVKGPAKGAPVFIASFAEFQRKFGGFLSEYTHGEYRYLAYGVEQFFANGGNSCFVARVIPKDALCAAASQGILSLTAADEGKWGNKLVADLSWSFKHKMQLLEKKGEKTYRAKTVSGFREGDYVKFEEEYNRISTINEDVLTFEEEFMADPVDTGMVAERLVYLLEMDMAVHYGDTVESFTGLTLNHLSPNYLTKRLEKSELIRAELSEKELSAPEDAIIPEGSDGCIIALSGGSDGSLDKVDAGTFMGEDFGPGRRTGIQAFQENSVISMIAVPGVTIPEVIASLVAHCENLGSRFAVLDMPADLSKPDELIRYRSMIDSTYAAMYHPWIQVYDRVTGRPGFIPPSGAVLGVYSRTDLTRGVHKAPANETVSCTGLSVPYTKSEQDLLNPQGINLIRALPGQGIRIWGARTAGSNSSFRYINVRRLFIFVEESIRVNTGWVVFEPNDPGLWLRVKMTISAFLENLWRNGMLSGGTASEAFFVDIGPSTMTQDDIMAGRLICNVGIAPSRPAEFVIFRVTQATAEAAQ